MIGVSYGAPTEFRARGKILEGEIRPDQLSNAISQDDLYVEMTFAKVMDALGLNATSAQYGEAFKASKQNLWHALLDWSAQHPDDWRKVWQRVEDKWDKDDPCTEGALQPFNIDAKLNGAYIAFGVLYGKGDFDKAMEIATRCGQDSDCNPSSAAGVLGAMLGFSRIPAAYKSELAKIADTKFQFTDYSFNDIVKSTEARALKIIQNAGGKVTDTEVVIPFQTPKAPKLEQCNFGVPDKVIGSNDPA